MPLMESPAPLLLYALLVAGVIALPGMDMAFVAASSLAHGLRGGAAALSGIVMGGLVHLGAGLLGLGWLLQTQPWLFNALLLAGALYVAGLAWPLLRSREALQTPVQTPVQTAQQTTTPVDGAALARRGLLTCLLNPKAYVFSLSVLPGYLSREPSRLLALVAITASAQILIYGAVALAAARGQRRFVSQPGLPRLVGVLLLLSALIALFGGWRRLSFS